MRFLLLIQIENNMIVYFYQMMVALKLTITLFHHFLNSHIAYTFASSLEELIKNELFKEEALSFFILYLSILIIKSE